ncbi:MAG: ABC-F family ATP-binding cassette domain-containing protein [Clostridia bacterium]|nr:ABC-F family ATP-binding cassette domain-containing protein [Clostridia bacterium]
MIAISINDLTLRFGTTTILEKISFSLEENDKLGIIGVNGSGKSSLFKLILGEYEPEEGNVYISKGKTVGVLTQEGAFTVSDLCGDTALEQMYTAFPELLNMEARIAELEQQLDLHGGRDAAVGTALTAEYTDLYNRFVALGGLEFRGRCAAILQKMGFDETLSHRSVDLLSGGQRTRLALARQLCREPDILLLDEPTNHLDMETLAWLETFLIGYKKCVMVISHDRYFLDRVTNKTLSVEHHRAKLYQGGYTKSMEQRRIDREIAEKQYRDQQKEIARQEAYIAQQRQWNRERNIIAAESRQKALDRMEKLEKPMEDEKAIRLKFTQELPSGGDVITVKDLTMGFGAQTLFTDIGFLIKRTERVFVIGPNGCGKSTLIKLLLGKLAPLAGKIEMGYNVEIGYYDQENQNLTPSNTVLEELWSAYPTMREMDIRAVLAAFRFFADDMEKTVRVLSGGERARLTLAKLILSHMNLLILDEPTNHLDINSREALEGALDGFDGTVFVVSHDRYLVEKLATRILEIKPGPAFDGDLHDYHVDHVGHGYTEYQTFKQERIARMGADTGSAATVRSESSASREAYLQNKAKLADERKQKNRLARLQKEAEALEAELEEISAALFGDAATDYKKAAALQQRQAEAEERLMEIYEEIGV